jgi:phosphoesterase RecJ-like protein
MEEKIKKLWALIVKADSIALFSHIRMDPDTFWSSTALYYILEKMWKKVVLLNDEQAPEEFKFLWANDLITTNCNLKTFNPDLVISLDAASIEQLAESYKNNKEAISEKDFVVIDHHITNNWFGDINIIDVKSSSTCELLFSILEEIGLSKYINAKIASLLITWILTDTNIFYNTNTTTKTHEVAAKLLDLWADSRTSIFEFFKKKSIKQTRLTAIALSKIQIIENKLKNWKNIVYTLLEQKDFEETFSSNRDTSWIIENLVNIENTDISFIIYPVGKRNKVSFRSREYDVSKISAEMWWGWHKQAAWFYSEKCNEEIVEEILSNIK